MTFLQAQMRSSFSTSKLSQRRRTGTDLNSKQDTTSPRGNYNLHKASNLSSLDFHIPNSSYVPSRVRIFKLTSNFEKYIRLLTYRESLEPHSRLSMLELRRTTSLIRNRVLTDLFH